MALIEQFDRPLNATPAWAKRLAFADPDSATENITFEQLLDLFNGGAVKTILAIGTWDMDSMNSLTFETSIPFANILSAEAWIKNDDNTRKTSLVFSDAYSTGNCSGEITFSKNGSNTDVTLWRVSGGYFDNTSFDSAPYDRGVLIIEYLPY